MCLSREGWDGPRVFCAMEVVWERPSSGGEEDNKCRPAEEDHGGFWMSQQMPMRYDAIDQKP